MDLKMDLSNEVWCECKWNERGGQALVIVSIPCGERFIDFCDALPKVAQHPSYPHLWFWRVIAVRKEMDKVIGPLMHLHLLFKPVVGRE